jgi:integrase/recombinase XerD
VSEHPTSEVIEAGEESLTQAIESSPAVLDTSRFVDVVSRYPTTDSQALDVVLNSFAGHSQNTQRAYRKEMGRFLLWLQATREYRPDMLRKVTTQEIQEYALFLLNPRPFDAGFLAHHGWRHSPFRKPLSESSRAYAIRLITLMFSRLQNLESEGEAPYSKFNPAVHVSAAYKRRGAKTNRIRKAFDSTEWQAIITTIDNLPRTTAKDDAIYYRARWIFAFMYHTFSRIGDVAALKMSSFRREKEGWYIELVGKGNLEAEIIATPELIYELSLYRKSLSLPELPTFEETTPGVVAFRKKSGNPYSGLSSKSIYLLCKEIFHRAAILLADSDPTAASRFRAATPHWLRHTSITHALEQGIKPRYVQSQARHSSLSVTAGYDHADRSAWRDDFEKNFSYRSKQ